MAYFVGLTGGIGSGKSTVCEMFAARGAVIVDADQVVREVQQPGTEAFADIVEAFGDGVVAADGTLDRQAIADIVFADADRLAELNAIVHPRVGARFAERVGELRETDDIVILDIPLLGASKSGSERLAQAVVVVTAPDGVRLDRLEARGLRRDDAEARMKNQISDEQRLEMADHVLDNGGDLQHLEEQVERLWAELQEANR